MTAVIIECISAGINQADRGELAKDCAVIFGWSLVPILVAWTRRAYPVVTVAWTVAAVPPLLVGGVGGLLFLVAGSWAAMAFPPPPKTARSAWTVGSCGSYALAVAVFTLVALMPTAPPPLRVCLRNNGSDTVEAIYRTLGAPGATPRHVAEIRTESATSIRITFDSYATDQDVRDLQERLLNVNGIRAVTTGRPCP